MEEEQKMVKQRGGRGQKEGSDRKVGMKKKEE